MSFSKIPISKKIVAGYAVFFIILIAISAFVIINSVLSLNNAQKLDIHDRANEHIKSALTNFQNARVNTRIMSLSDDYSENVFTEAKTFIKDSLKYIDDGIAVTNDNNLTDELRLLYDAKENVTKYQEALISINDFSCQKKVSKDSMPAIGAKAMNSLLELIDAENEIIRSEIREGNPQLLNNYNGFIEFKKLETELYATRLLTTRLSYLSDMTAYSDIVAAIEKMKSTLINYKEIIPANRIGAVDEALSNLDDYLAVFTNHYDILSNLQSNVNNLSTFNDVSQTALNSVSELASGYVTESTDKLLANAKTNLTVVIILMTIAFIVNISLAAVIVSSINKSLDSEITKLTGATSSIVSAASQLLEAAGSLAQGGSEQAAAIEQTSATMNETASMVQMNTQNTREAAVLTGDTVDAAVKGVSEMENLIDFMDKLRQSSTEINQIVGDINSISFQTNILALNASVEAVRAGDAGRSFAVVAEEVRNLSQQSSAAANNTSEIIGKNIKLSNQSVENSKSVGETLQSIASAIQKVNALITEITSASEEQARGVQQINIALSQMEKVTQSNAAVSQESAAAANELRSQANTLEEITGEIRELVGH